MLCAASPQVSPARAKHGEPHKASTATQAQINMFNPFAIIILPPYLVSLYPEKKSRVKEK
jgi:hypothetical protein